MSTAEMSNESAPARRGGALSGLWHRQLDQYPENRMRYVYLGIVVLATIVLYYEYYVEGAVSPAIISHYGLSFRFYVNVVVISNAVGALTSLLAGLADRWGRSNLVVFGLLVTGLITLVGLPNAPTGTSFGILYGGLGFVEGIMLVATPALVRDFSPQLGRASAMGFWTLGPVVGSLVVTEVSSHTLSHLRPFQDQFIICGIVGLCVFAIALVGLRELSPRLRDQLMVSIRDRALIQARARGLDIVDALKRPFQQMLHLDILGSALAISLFLLIYYTAVGFMVIYFVGVFGFSQQESNSLLNWWWAFNAGSLIVVGVVSDKIRVRKPFMVIGGVGSMVMTYLFLTRATHPHTGYYTLVTLVSILSVFMAIAFAPWMAAFTETVERRNPALTATGLAVWGLTIRAVVAISTFILPYVVTSTTPLVEYGTQAAAIVKQYPTQVATLQALDPKTAAALAANPTNPPPAALATALREIATAQHVSTAVALQHLLAAAKVPKSDVAFLQAHGAAVLAAQKSTPGQWQNWFWICFGGQALFLPLILVMAGRWSPRKAKEDEEAHEAAVREEMARLGIAPEPEVASGPGHHGRLAQE